MNKLLILATTLFLSTNLFSQDNDFTLSNVLSSSGKPVFLNVEPFDAYTKAFTFANKLTVEDDDFKSMQEIMGICIQNANTESGLQGETYDAIIVKDNEPRSIAINFIEKSNTNTLAKIGYLELGVYVFLACEPSNEYDYIATVNVRYHRKPEQLKKAYLEIIERSIKKHPNFDGLIFKDDLRSADLIKFRGLEATGGGFRVGDKAIYSQGSKPRYGEIAQLDNTKQAARFKFYDDYGDEKLKSIAYSKLQSISEELYQTSIERQNQEIEKHKFMNGDKVTWVDGEKLGYGEVVSLNMKSHDATLNSLNKYGEQKTSTIDFLKIDKLDDSKFQEYRKRDLTEIKKHQYEIGQKISFIVDKKSKCGEVVNLNNTNHTATIKYLGVFAEDKTSQENYFDVEKISEEKHQEETAKYIEEAKKYKFEIGEKIIWSSRGIFRRKSESINAEILFLNDSEHNATIKYIKDDVEKQETVSYLELTKLE